MNLTARIEKVVNQVPAPIRAPGICAVLKLAPSAGNVSAVRSACASLVAQKRIAKAGRGLWGPPADKRRILVRPKPVGNGSPFEGPPEDIIARSERGNVMVIRGWLIAEVNPDRLKTLLTAYRAKEAR